MFPCKGKRYSGSIGIFLNIYETCLDRGLSTMHSVAVFKAFLWPNLMARTIAKEKSSITISSMLILPDTFHTQIGYGMERIVIQKCMVLNKETFKSYSTQTGSICQLSYPLTTCAQGPYTYNEVLNTKHRNSPHHFVRRDSK